jgi:holin-like protein
LILVGFHAVGVGLHRVGVPLPAGVLGLLLFLGALVTGVVKLKWVEETADLMVRHMLLLFVPLLAGLMVMGDVLRHDALPLIASMVVSLVAVLLTTGGLAHFLLGDGLHEVSGDMVAGDMVAGDMVAGDMVAGDVVTGVEAEDAGRDRVERDYGKRGLDD